MHLFTERIIDREEAVYIIVDELLEKYNCDQEHVQGILDRHSNYIVDLLVGRNLFTELEAENIAENVITKEKEFNEELAFSN